MKCYFLKPCFLYDQAQERLRELEDVYSKLGEELAMSPPGKIHIIHSGGRVQYYLRRTSKEKSGIYLSKSDLRKIKVYLQKSYDEKVLKILEKEIKVLKAFLGSFSGLDESLQKVYEAFPDKSKEFLQPLVIPNSEFIQAWVSAPYTGKALPKDAPDFVTNNGERVRSKSELNIANALYGKKIPYKYECPLKLDKYNIIYPDFTVLNPRTRKVLYWEHRGMMDDGDYAKHTVKRLKDYQAAGMYLGKDVVITEETLATPLGITEISRVIEHYLT